MIGNGESAFQIAVVVSYYGYVYFILFYFRNDFFILRRYQLYSVFIIARFCEFDGFKLVCAVWLGNYFRRIRKRSVWLSLDFQRELGSFGNVFFSDLTL